MPRWNKNLGLCFHIPVYFRLFLARRGRNNHDEGAFANNVSFIIHSIKYMSSNIFFLALEGRFSDLKIFRISVAGAYF
jgi:hypothetical protein